MRLSTQARDGGAYRYLEAGFNFRLPNVNAALGLAQLGRLDAMLAAKRAIAARYDEALAGRDDLVPMPRCAWAESGCWLYSVRCASRADAAALVRHLDGAGIEARIFWEALSEQAPYADAPRHLDRRCRAPFRDGRFAAMFEPSRRSGAGAGDRGAGGMARRAPEGGGVSLLLVGAGGHARAIAEALAAAQSPVDTYVDPQPARGSMRAIVRSDERSRSAAGGRFRARGRRHVAGPAVAGAMRSFAPTASAASTPRTRDPCERSRQRR